MSRRDLNDEDRFAALLAACDERVAAGLPAPEVEAAVGPGLAGRLRRANSCLLRLERLWPRSPAGGGGPTLASWLTRQSAPVPPRLAAQLLAQLADTIHHLHGQGVVYGGIRPGNVLLDPVPESPPGGLAFTARLADLGLARAAAEEGILGPLAYLAPEQAVGRHDQVGPPTDVYALGVLLYELLTKQVPFAGASALEVLEEVAWTEPTAVRSLRPDLPRNLATICLKCLQKDPLRRYRSAAELADDLGRFLAGRPIRARAPCAGERLGRWARRHGAVLALVGLAALTLLALAALR